MSLIVARISSSSVFLVSDTKITYTNKSSNAYIEGISKVTLLDEYTCIAFAGNVDRATRAINKVFSNMNINDILNSLSQASENYEDVQFLVVSISPNPNIWLIENGTAKSSPVAWIGDIEGFRKYQSYYTNYDNPENVYAELTRLRILKMPEGDNASVGEEYSRMFNCIAATIDSYEVNSVGGFILPVLTHNGRLQYGTYFSLFRQPLQESEIINNLAPISFGDASMGSFSINFSGQNTECIAVHLEQGNLGILFEKMGENILKPKLYKEIDEIDFSTLLDDRFGGELACRIASSSVHYFKKAETYIQKNDYQTALPFLNEGIKISSKTWKGTPHNPNFQYESLSSCLKNERPPLKIPIDEVKNLSYAFFLRGFSYINLNNYSKAIIDFRESLMLVPSDFNSMYWKVRAEHASGDIKGAIASAKECCTMHDNYEAFMLCSELLREVGDFVEALEYVKKAQIIERTGVM